MAMAAEARSLGALAGSRQELAQQRDGAAPGRGEGGERQRSRADTLKESAGERRDRETERLRHRQDRNMQGQVDKAMQEMVEKVREQEAESGDIEEEGQIEESRQRTDTATNNNQKAADWLETRLYNKVENLAWLTSHASYTD